MTEKEKRRRGAAHDGLGFHFEARWLKEEKCAEAVGEAWETAVTNGLASTQEAIKIVAGSLKQWGGMCWGIWRSRKNVLKRS
jgi:hypothetical protein